MAKTIRVYKSEGEWVVKRDEASRASGRFYTQKEAYLYARDIALNNGLTITVYYPNGGLKAVINPKNREEESNCFITTACVQHYNLPDNCYQLQTLRTFRDDYLRKQKIGNELIAQYYSVAPTLVKILNQHPDKDDLFKKIFHQINIACTLIERKENAKAKKLYMKVVSNLLNHFNLHYGC